MATPYVVSSDLVSAYPAKSLEIAQYIDGFKADLALVQNAQTGTTYSFVAADFTKLVTLSNASPVAVELAAAMAHRHVASCSTRAPAPVAGDVGVTQRHPLTATTALLTKTGTDLGLLLPFSSGVGSAPAVTVANHGHLQGYRIRRLRVTGTLTTARTSAGHAGGGQRTAGLGHAANRRDRARWGH
jgi:hypothetical protein